MANVITVIGFQPNEMNAHDANFFNGLGANTLAYQTGNLQSVDYDKSFIQTAHDKFSPTPFLCSMDSHDFNNWDDDNHWNTVLANTRLIALNMKIAGATGVILNCEQENHLIPAGPFSQRSDPLFVWPGNTVPPKPVSVKKGQPAPKPTPTTITGPTRCRQWVRVIKAVWPTAQIHLWLTSAVQTDANAGFYPCINAICEEAGGCFLWLYMWNVGYGFGSDPNLPKKKVLPDKFNNGKTWIQIGKPSLWEQAALQTFTQKVKNTVVPCFSFTTDTANYYKNQIAAKQVKDFSNMIDQNMVNFYKQTGNSCLIIWGDAMAVDPGVYPYTQNLIKTLQKG